MSLPVAIACVMDGNDCMRVLKKPFAARMRKQKRRQQRGMGIVAMEYFRCGMVLQSVTVYRFLKEDVHFVTIRIAFAFFKIGSVQLFSKIIEFFGAVGIDIFFFRENGGVDKDETDVFPEKFKISH